jgi:two-component system chemotaxis response regulator CheV
MTQTNILLEAGTNELEIVEFYIDEAEAHGKDDYKGYYGVNVAKVLEIIRLPQVTELPEASHHSILGAFDLRDQIIPLVDLSAWLDKKRIPNENEKVIVTEFNKATNGFMVSGVTRIHRVSWQEVEPPNRYVSAFSNHSITGVVKMDDRIIFLLDLEKIVADLNPELAGQAIIDLEPREAREKMKALVVDDSALVREMLRDHLEKAGFMVEALTNGQAGWDYLQEIRDRANTENRPIQDLLQIVVSDIEMPAMDGHHLTKRIKDDPVLGQLPVVLFSSLITDRLRHKGEAVGADDQISKPEVGQLAQRCQALVAQYEERASA